MWRVKEREQCYVLGVMAQVMRPMSQKTHQININQVGIMELITTTIPIAPPVPVLTLLVEYVMAPLYAPVVVEKGEKPEIQVIILAREIRVGYLVLHAMEARNVLTVMAQEDNRR